MQSSIAHTDLVPALPTFIPPLDVARHNARRMLDEANALDLAVVDSPTVANAFGGVCEVLRQVLGALDVEDGRDA
ncbi:hypothetical protein ABZ468_25645 [Streptomyces sp. NPDC005708]|uniref:hypothetical protein n=1 Tax=Streptomyces sp. NPDC005708 TaxID=3154564 RepID=UPI0033FA0C49